MTMKTSTWAMLSALTFTFPVCMAAGEIPIRSGDKVAFLGDSITEHGFRTPSGYVNLVMDGLKSAGIQAQCIPAGVSGDGARQMLARIEKDVISKKPQWMFFSCGVNDCSNGMDNPGIPLEEYKEKVSKMLELCRNAEIKVIILSATPVVEEPEHAANKNLIPYNEYLHAVAKERNLPLIDLNKAANDCIAQKADKQKRMYTVDGTHMNPRGNIVLASAILKGLGMDDALLKSCQERWIKNPNAWQPAIKISMDLEEMEKVEKAIPDGMKLDDWILSLIREKIK